MSAYTYKNKYGNTINEVQANTSELYYREKLIDNNKQIVELVKNNKVAKVDYYIGIGDDFNDLLPQYADQTVCFHKKTIVNNYIVLDNYLFEKNVLIGKSNTVLNSDEEPICFQKRDINSNEPILGSTEKSFYDSNNVEKYIFDYNDDGICFMIEDLQNNDEILASNIGQSNVSFTWSGFEYYQNALPIIPV